MSGWNGKVTEPAAAMPPDLRQSGLRLPDLRKLDPRKLDLRKLDPRKLDPRKLDRRKQWIPLLLAVSGWVVLGISALPAPSALRFVAVFVFALAVPGIAVVRLLPLKNSLERAVLSIAISMSLASLVAEGAYISGNLQPAVVLAVLSGICSVAALAELLRGGSTP